MKHSIVAASSRTDIPLFFRGEKVGTINLKTESMNNKFGKIQGWNENKMRYIVQLQEHQEFKLFKPVNIDLICDLDHPFSQFEDSEDCLNVKEGIKIIQMLQIPLSHSTLTSITRWLYKVKCIYHNVTKLLKMMQKISKYLLKQCPKFFGDILILLKCIIASTQLYFARETKDYETPKLLLLNCVENHYGFLPLILSELSFLMVEKSLTKLPQYSFIKLYFQSKNLIENRIFQSSPKIKKTFSKRMLTFAVGDLCQAHGCENIHNFIPALKNERVYLQTMIDPEDEETAITLAYNYFFENNFEKSLETLNEMETKISKTWSGIRTICLDLHFLQMKIHIQLQNKNMSMRAFKRWGKFAIHRNEDLRYMLKAWEDEIKELPSSSGDEKLERRTIEKCANLKCFKIENSIGEFKVCSNCEIAHYCSRKCQKFDWSRRHRKVCGL